jgi:hypothetical protein
VNVTEETEIQNQNRITSSEMYACPKNSGAFAIQINAP